QGPPGTDRSSSVPDQKGIEAAPAVTAALRWRGRCVFKALRMVEPSQAGRGRGRVKRVDSVGFREGDRGFGRNGRGQAIFARRRAVRGRRGPESRVDGPI